jgi:hypothetical protein
MAGVSNRKRLSKKKEAQRYQVVPVPTISIKVEQPDGVQHLPPPPVPESKIIEREPSKGRLPFEVKPWVVTASQIGAGSSLIIWQIIYGLGHSTPANPPSDYMIQFFTLLDAGVIGAILGVNWLGKK